MSQHSRAVFNSGLKVLLSQVTVAVASVGFTVFLARVLTKTEFATFAVYGILTAFVGMLASLGLETTVIQKAPSMLRGDRSEQGMAMMKTALLSRCVMAFLLSASVYILSAQISEWFLHTSEYASLIRWMAFGTALSSIFQGLQLLGQAAQEFGSLSGQIIITNLFQRFLAIGLYFALGLKGYIIGLSLGPLVGVIGMLYMLRHYLFNRVQPAFWLPMVRYSLPYYLYGFARYGFSQADQVVIGLLLTPETLATYSIARQMANYLRIGIEAFLTPVMTKVAEMRESDMETLQRAFEKTSKYFSLVVVPICATITLVSPWLMELYGGAKYRDGWPILAVLSLAQLAYYIGSLYSIFVYVVGRPKDLLFLNMAVGGSSVLFSVLLIGLIGKAGIAWSQFLAFVLMIVVAKRIVSPIVVLHFETKVISVLAVPLLVGGGIILLGQLLYFRLWAVPLCTLVAGVLVILTIGSRLDDDDWTQIRALVPGHLSTAVDRAQKVFKWRSRTLLVWSEFRKP